MKFSRRSVLKITGVSVFATAILPRMAFAARNSLRSMRTGVQPGNKTRLVIETANRPSYTLTYAPNQLIVRLANTSANTNIAPKLATDTLVKSLTQTQNGDALQITANLTHSIDNIPKNQILLLEPNGDNDYRLVLDFVAGTSNPVKTATATATTAQTTQKSSSMYGSVPEYTTASAMPTTAITAARKYVIVIDAGHGGKDPGCIGKGGTREKDIVLSVAKKLKSKLDTNGFKTYLTRSDDRYLKLAERASIGSADHADNKQLELSHHRSILDIHVHETRVDSALPRHHRDACVEARMEKGSFRSSRRRTHNRILRSVL